MKTPEPNYSTAVPSLFEIFWGKLANGKRRIAEWRRKGLLNKTAYMQQRGGAMRFEHLEPRILLSADLTHVAPIGGAVDATLKVEDLAGAAILRLVDNPSGSILAEQLLDTDIDVSVFGSDQGDRLKIDFDPAALAHRVRFSFDGAGGYDELIGGDGSTTWLLDAPGDGSNDHGTFTNVESIAGGAGVDTLKGPAGDTTWTVSGPDSGHVAGVEFSGMENLEGAADNADTFVFEASGTLSGVADGGAGGFDSLVVSGSFDTLVFTPTGPHSGYVDRDGAVIEYDGLEPVDADGSVANVVFNGDGGADDADTWVLEDSATPGNMQLHSTTGQIETTQFTATASTVTLNLGVDDDSVTIASAGDSGFGGDVTINGGANDDAFVFEVTTAGVDYEVDGQTGTDMLDLTSLAGAATNLTMSNVDHTITNGTSTIAQPNGITEEIDLTLSAGLVTALQNGLDDFVDFGDALIDTASGISQLLNTLPFLGTQVAEVSDNVGLDDILALGEPGLFDNVHDMISAAVTGLGANPTLTEVIAAINSAGNLGFIDDLTASFHDEAYRPKGDVNGGALEILLDLDITADASDSFELDLGEIANFQGLDLGTIMADATVSAVAHITIGLTTGLVPQFFLLPGGTLTLTLDVDATLTGSEINLGILEMEGAGTLSYQGVLELTLTDPDTDANDDRIVAGEMTTSAVTVNATTDSYNATAAVNINAGVATEAGSITMFADAGGGFTTVTSAQHGLSNGDEILIEGTTSYNGTFTVSNVTADTFRIADPFVADDATGTWSKDLSLAQATLEVSGSIFGNSSGPAAAPSVSLDWDGGAINLFDSFNNMTPLELLGLLGDAANTFATVTGSDLLDQEIPFTSRTIGDVLNFAETFKTEVLDPLFKSNDATKPDFNGDSAIDQDDLNFTGIQELLDTVGEKLGLPPISALYDDTTKELKFTVDFARAFGIGNGEVTTLRDGDGVLGDRQQLEFNRNKVSEFRFAFINGSGDLVLTNPIETSLDQTDLQVAAAIDVALEALTEIGNVAVTPLDHGNITAFANSVVNPGQKTRVTSNAHGLVNGDIVYIGGTDNYNGRYGVSNVTTNTFDITKVFSLNDGASHWGKGVYDITFGDPLSDFPHMSFVEGLSINFGESLGEFASVETSGSFYLAAGLDTGLTFGVDLSPSTQIALVPPVFVPDKVGKVDVVTVVDGGQDIGGSDFTEEQVTVTVNATEGTFRLAFRSTPGTGSFNLSDPIDFDASAAAFKAALTSVTGWNIPATEFTVTKDGSNPVYTITFLENPPAVTGNFDDINVEIVADDGILSANATFSLKLSNLGAPILDAEGNLQFDPITGEVIREPNTPLGTTGTITVTAAETMNNASLQDLAADVQKKVDAAINAAGLTLGFTSLSLDSGDNSVAVGAGEDSLLVPLNDIRVTLKLTDNVDSDNDFEVQRTLRQNSVITSNPLVTLYDQAVPTLANLRTELQEVINAALAAAGTDITITVGITGGTELTFTPTNIDASQTLTISTPSLVLASAGGGRISLSGQTVSAIVDSEGDITAFADAGGGFTTVTSTGHGLHDGETVFITGAVNGSITAFADSVTDPGVKTTVTSTAHGLSNGREIQIAGTDAYNGSFTVSNVTANTFDIEVAFDTDEATGDWSIFNDEFIVSNVTANTFDIEVAFVGGATTAEWTTDPNFPLVPSSLVDRDVQINIPNAVTNTAYTELGLATSPTRFDGKITHDIELTLQVNGFDVDVTVQVADTNTNQTIHDLVDDLQSAVDAALLLSAGGFDGDEIEVKLYDPNGNRIQFLAVEGEGVNKLAIFIDESDLNNGAFTELGFDADQLVDGQGETKKAKADTFFLEDVHFSGEFAVLAHDITATASVGFLGVKATLDPTLELTGDKIIGADVDFALRNPVDGSTRVAPEVIGNAIADGKFFFDAAEGFGGTDEDPQTGFIDGTIDGGVGLSLDISPDGAFSGLPASISASLDLKAESPNWLISPPRLSDPLGFEEVLKSGTAQGGANTSVTLAASSATQNDFYNGSRIRITGGTGKVGEMRHITDYDGGTKIATVDASWTTNPDNTTTYEILLEPIRFNGTNTETLGTALSGGTLAENVSIVVSNNDNGVNADPFEAVGLLEAGNYGNAAGLQAALQDVVDDALKRLEDIASLAPGTLAGDITIGLVSNHLTATGEAGMSLRANRIVLDFAGPDFDDILSQFRDFSFDDILAALQLVVDFLQGMKESGVAGEVFDAEIPLINRSVGDLIDAGDEFLDFVEQLSNNPAGSLQELEKFFRDQLDLPQLADPLGLAGGLGSEILKAFNSVSPFTFDQVLSGGKLAEDLSFRLMQGGQEVLVELRAAETQTGWTLNQLRDALQAKIDAALVELGVAGDLTVSHAGGLFSLTPSGGLEAEGVSLNPFSLFSLDIPNGILNLDYNFSAHAEENRPFNLDLAAAGLPAVFTNLIGVSTSGLLAVSADLELNLGLGLDLLGDDKGFFIRTDATNLTASASASGSNLNFSGMIGPLGLFVKGGSASLSADFSAGMADPNGNQRFNLVALGDGTLETDLDDIGDFIVFDDLVPGGGDTVFLSANASASLPLFFGLESSPVPLGDPNVLGATIDLVELIVDADPSDSGYSFTLPDIDFNDLTALIPDLFGMLADPAVMIDSLNLLLKTIQDTLNGQIFGFELPLVGDLLADNPVSNFIENFRVDVLQPFANTLRQSNANLDGLILLIRQTFFDAFGPSALDILKDSNNDDLITVADVVARFLDDVGDPFEDENGDPVNFLSATALQFDFDIGKEFSFQTPEIVLDLGVRAFGLNANLRPRVNIDFNLHLGFGVHEDLGFYFVADHATPELTADVTVDFGSTTVELPFDITESELEEVLNGLALGEASVVSVVRSTPGGGVEYAVTFDQPVHSLLPIQVDGGPNVSITGGGTNWTIALDSASGDFAVAAPAQLVGRLLFLALGISDGVDLMGDGYDTIFGALTDANQLPGEDFSKLSLAASLDIQEDSGDGKLSFPELFSQSLDDTFDIEVFGAALLRAHAVVDFSTISDEVARLLPSISTDIIVDFSISFDDSAGLEIGEPNIGLANISVDLGDIIDGIAGDILKKVKEILEPTEWLIGPDGLLNFRIPLLSDLAGTKLTIRNTLLPLFAPDEAPIVNKFLDVVEQLFFLVDLIDDAASDADGLTINFGDFIVTGGQDFADQYTGVFGGLDVVSLLKGSDDQDITDISQLQKFDPSKIKIPSAAELETPPNAASTTKSFVSGVTKEGSFQLELFKPETIFKLLLGQPDVTLFTVELPEFGFEFLYRQSFPIIGPLVGFFSGGIGAHFDFGFGMDTRGLSQFLASGNPAMLLNGVFINDLDPATGFDRHEITFTAQIAVGAGIDLGLIKAGVEGGIEATINFNFADLDRDGKIRFDELAANLVANDFNPISVFDVSGLIEFFMRAFVEINLFITTITLDFEFVRLTLFEFNIPFERPAIMASQSGDTLTLNIGSSAAQRLNGNTSDIGETVHVESFGGGIIVWSDQFNVNREVAKISPFFGVTTIVADGGAGNDVIDLALMTEANIIAEIEGGEGDDEITGGWGPDMLVGGGGRDRIFGNKGEDELHGGLGDDELFGEDDDDVLLGEQGHDKLDGGDHDDTLDGGVGNNFYTRSAGEDVYTLLNTGSTQFIDGVAGNPELNLTELFGSGITLPTSFNIFLKDGAILVGSGDLVGDTTLHQILNSTFNFPDGDSVPDFYEQQIYVADASGFTDIVGGEFSDNFYVVDTPNAITLNGGAGADHYFLITSDAVGDATATVTIHDVGEGLAEANTIEVVDPGLFGFASFADHIRVTENTITLDVGGSQDTITYESPAGVQNTDQLVLNISTLGLDDLVEIESTSLTVPVRVDTGGGNDKVIAGGGADGIDEIKSILQPGGNGNVGFGPLVLVGGEGTDVVLVDDSQDSSDDIGNVTAFLETREVQPTTNGDDTVFTGDFEIGVVSGLGMRFKVQTGVVDDFDEDTVDVDPIFSDVLEQDGRIEFEGFEVLDLQMGSGDDLLTIGGGFDLDKTSLTAGQAHPDMRLDNAQLPVNRLKDPDNLGGIGVKETLHTYSGLTLVHGNGGNDEIDVLFTQDLEQTQARASVVGGPAGLPYLELDYVQDGVKFVDEEIVELDIKLDTGYFVFEFSDPTGTDTVPGAEQSIVLPFDASATDIKNALEGMRLVGPAFVQSVDPGVGVDWEITFKKDLGDLPDLKVFATQLLLSGGGDGDEFNVQSIEQPTYILGGSDGTEGDEININVFLDENGTDTSNQPPEPLFVPIPAQATSNGVNDLLTADGEGDGDDYLVYLFGGTAESQINLFDSGSSSDGTDSAKVLGTPVVDLFLMRAAVANDGLAFVALLKPESGDWGEEPKVEDVVHVERVNYTGALDSMEVFGLEENDRFGIDDVRVDMTIYGGPGEEFFQVGQLYKSQRNAAAGVPNADVFATIETTRGFLSNGISSPLSIYGGIDNDEFVVYHNLAPLALFGDDGNDSFLIRAFALVGSQEDLRERTDVSGDAGADLIQYAVNAPVNIDGGDGFDTVIVIGTEFNDDFVVTENGVFGAGLNILFTRVESVEVDGAEGDDRFFIRGSGAELITQVTGGLGSDTFFVNGPTPDVVSNDLLGHTGIISHQISSTGVLDSEYAGQKVLGIGANVADDDEPAIRIVETDGSSAVSQALGDFDAYYVVLTRKPENGAEVVVKAFAPRGVRFIKAGDKDNPDNIAFADSDSAILTFDDTNWDTPQIVVFIADQQGVAVVKEAVRGSASKEENEVQVLSVGATGGTFRLRLGADETGDITYNPDNVAATAAAIESAINSSGINSNQGITVDVSGSGTSFTIEFTVPAETDVGLLEVPLATNDLVANDIEGIQPGFITHEMQVQAGAIDNGDTIEGLFVAEPVPAGSNSLKVFGGLPTFITDQLTDQGIEALRGATVKVIGGSGIGQVRLVIGNTLDELFVNNPWSTPLDDTSRIEILRYDGVVAPALLVDIIGDDAPFLDVRETGGNTYTVEAPEVHKFVDGNTDNVDDDDDINLAIVDTITVSLTQQPNENVTVALDGSDAFLNEQLFFAIKVGSEFHQVTSLTFTDSTWNDPQTVYIFGDNDALVEGFHKSVLRLEASQAQYDGVDASVVVDIWDDEVAGVLVVESAGTTDVIETGHGNFDGAGPTFAPDASDDAMFIDGAVPDEKIPAITLDQDFNLADDDYKIVLTKAPKAGETVRVNLIEEPTRTQRGAGLLGIRAFTQEVSLSADFVDFTIGDWFDVETITVSAENDDRVDGQDSMSFPTKFDLANSLEGPLVVTGGVSEDRSADLEREPVMLPGETNFKPEIGSVVDADSFTITIDLDEVVDGTTDVLTVEQGGSTGKITIGTNTDGRTDPPAPSDAQEVQVVVIDAVRGQFELSLTDPNLNLGAEQMTGLITWDIFDTDNLANVELALETAIGGWTDIDNVEVEAFDNVFMITFDTNPNFLNINELAVKTNNLTKVGAHVIAPLPSTDEEVVQELIVYGNSGTFRLEYDTEVTADITFDPDDPNVDQKQLIQAALQAALDAQGDGITALVQGSGAFYTITLTNPDPGVTTVHSITVDSDTDLDINEVQTLRIDASSGNFKLKVGAQVTATPVEWDANPATLRANIEAGLESLVSIDSVEVRQDDPDQPVFTIVFLDPAATNFDEIEVIDSTLERTVREAIQTKLGIEELTSPDQLEDFTIEIVREEAKNKIRLITGGTSEMVSGHEHFVLEVNRPWEGGLLPDIPTSNSLFTIETTNPNLLVDENEETDLLFLNDSDNVSSSPELPTAELTISATELQGLGMSSDPQTIGTGADEITVPGGIVYKGLEELYIDLGTGDNKVTINDTHRGATILNAGRGMDVIEVLGISGHTFVNAGPDADHITVTDGQLVEGIGALLTITGDVPQVRVVTIGKGSPADAGADVEAVDEVQQFTVDATAGTFQLGFIDPDDPDRTLQFTGELDFDASAEEVEDALEALDGIDPGDVEVGKFGPIYRVEFHNGLGARDIDLLATNDLGLTMEGPIDTLIVNDSAETEDSLALLTSTSLTGLGMYSVNEIQTLRINATEGQFQLSFGLDTTGLLDFDISAEDLQLALEGLDGIGEGNIRVDRNDDVYVLRFRGTLTNTNVPDITVEPGHTLKRDVEQPGGLVVQEDGDIEALTRLQGTTVVVQNEVQELEITADSGTFRIQFGSDAEDQTDPLTIGEFTVGDLFLALESLDAIAAGDVSVVEGLDGVFTIEFIKELSATDLPLLQIVDGTGATITGVQDGLDTAINDVQVLTVEATGGTYTLTVTVPNPDTGVPLVFETFAIPFDASAELVRQTLQRSYAFAQTEAPVTRQLSIISATTGSFKLSFEGDETIALDHGLNATQLKEALVALDSIDDADINVVQKGAGLFEIEFVDHPFYETIPNLEVTDDSTDGEVVVSTVGVREAFKTDFEVTRIDNDYIISFQGKTRQTDAGPGVGFVVVNTGDLVGDAGTRVVTRMEGINYYGIEDLDILLGSGTDVVSVQGTGQGSYKYPDGLTASVATSVDGNGVDINEVQRLRLNASGTFTISLTDPAINGGVIQTTVPITLDPQNLDPDDVAQAIEDALNDLNGVEVEVTAANDKFTVEFLMAGSPDVAELELDTSDLLPIHTSTTISLDANASSEHVFVSSNADLDLNTIFDTDGHADPFDFLTGNLDDMRGDLSLDFGDGRHGLMVSDEASTAGDGDIVITDAEPALRDRNNLSPSAEIWITGLNFADGINFGSISYEVDPLGDLFEGVVYWTGSGDDTITIDGTHFRAGDERTTTVLNTGLGDDHVTVDLDTGEDDFFVLHTMGGAASVTPVDPGLVASDDDTVRAADSTLPLVIFGGLGDDDIIAGQNKDVVFGDFGRVQYVAAVTGDPATETLIAVLGFGGRGDLISSQIVDPRWVISRDLALGGVDILEGQADEDILIGGAGGNSIGDYIDGDGADDLIFGDAVRLFRRDIDVASTGDITNPRFQTLGGTQIYDTSATNSAGGALEDGIARNYRNQAGSVPSWAEYQVIELYHAFADVMAHYEVQPGVFVDLSDSFGDDYVAGGAAHDMIFGQLGDDTIQGDGSIQSAVGAESIVGNRVAGVVAGVGAHRLPDGGLAITPSFEATSDGDDYIEGNGGSDVLFGNLGQDDLIGGSSALFTLDLRSERPDASDTIFGGSGQRIGRNVDVLGGDAFFAERHGRDADAIAGDNANIYRVVGVNGTDGGSFVTFNYDVNGLTDEGYAATRRIIPRAVELLDYTPGGPDFTPGTESGPADIAVNPTTGLRDLGAADEVHGESGDDFIYGMVGPDVLFGDSQDDNMVGGYGADWMSGGTGDDGMLGDDGRLFASRNSAAYGEPLYGIAAIPLAEINKLISTPGVFNEAVINVSGQLKYTADLTPQNLQPSQPTPPDPLFPPLYANDIIYGGLGNDSIHSGAGDDAISGAEALAESYTNNYDQSGAKLTGAPIRSDFDHPFNPGNVLGYAPAGPNATKFALYDANDGMRKILLNGDGTLNKTNTGQEWLLNFNAGEGPLDSKWHVGTTYAALPTDGDDHIFADLGNDWIVGGTGRDVMYSGWGDDLMNADDYLDTNGGLNNSFPTPNFDTNPSREDLAFGGAGRDVLILNTNGDRGFDWLGEFNTFFTPYAQFGAASVNRLLQPQLPEYLYALSKSNGADPTLAAQYGSSAVRNGEPFGELGLVTQQDAAWQAQTGGPRDPQAGNTHGGKVDVKNNPGTTNVQPIYMTAGGSGPATGAADYLTDSQLASQVAAATSYWAEKLGAGDSRLDAFGSLRIEVGNLPDDRLGATFGNQILVDSDAAGYGWSLDSHDSAGRMDLFTVLTHEVGHTLGFDHHHDERFPVLRDELDPGMRYAFTAAPAASETGGLLARPTAAAMPSYGFDTAGGQGPSVAVVDWQASAGGDWGVQLSPYAPVKTAPKLAPSVAPFAPPQFDSMGKALLGKGRNLR